MKPYITAIAAATLLASCSGKENTTVLTQEEELPEVTVDVAHQQAVAQIKTYTATVEAENVNNISPSTPNRIKSIAVEVGDHVRRGQELVHLDASNSDQLRINMEQIEREYNRASQLLQIGSGTQQQVDQLRAQLDAARSQYNNMMENTILVSPITGVVTARNLDPGDMTGSQPILVVGQLTPTVKVMLGVSENDLSLVRRGMNVDVAFDAYTDRSFTGTVRRIYPTIDPATRTFEVEVAVNNADEAIKPGMFARVTMNQGEQNNVVVPDRAVVKQTGSGNKYVYVYSNGKVQYRRVLLGQRLDTAYELLDGINDGDTVVITGQNRLADGAQVKILER